jgi:hypothetical protein
MKAPAAELFPMKGCAIFIFEPQESWLLFF